MSNNEDSSSGEVDNKETLYRSIWLRQECFYFDQEGVLHVSAEAFADRAKQPSLYRKHLCDDPPLSDPPRKGPEQAVVSLIAGRIREAGSIYHKSEGKPGIDHIIKIVPDTSNGQHRSHCIVFADPDFPNSNAFGKLKLMLSQLVEQFDIEPAQEFLDQLPRPQHE